MVLLPNFRSSGVTKRPISWNSPGISTCGRWTGVSLGTLTLFQHQGMVWRYNFASLSAMSALRQGYAKGSGLAEGVLSKYFYATRLVLRAAEEVFCLI